MLRKAREKRARPLFDDKALVGWNSLAIAALVEAGETELAESVFEAMEPFSNEGLPHQVCQGKASGAPFLEDVAAWTLAAQALGKDVEPAKAAEPFEDPSSGGYFATSSRHEALFGRTRPAFDQPVPSGNGMLAQAFVQAREIERAEGIVRANLGWMERAPSATGALLLAALRILEARGGEAVTQESPIEASLRRRSTKEYAVTVRVAPGYHVNSSSPSAAWLVATEVSVEGARAEVQYPQPNLDRYEGSFEILVSLVESGDASILLRLQPCTEFECLLPIEFRFPVQPSS